MKHKALTLFTTAVLLFPKMDFAQAPTLGTAADFVLFTSVGAVSNTGISQLTGNVGSNSGLSTGFGNVNGVMHNGDGVTGTCAADLTLAYNQLNSAVPTFFPAPLLGNGQTLNAGVYSIAGAATLNLDLTLDGQGNSGAVFIFQVSGPFSANANSKVKLVNGAQACNVFWKIEGLVSLAAGVAMRGTIVANNAAINMNTNDTLEGRALSTAGAITIDGTLAYTPIGCGSPVLTGPLAPTLGTTACYTLFTAIGPATNAGVTNVTGDIGSNNGTTTGFNPLLVVGAIHGTPDGSTALCSTDLISVYNYLNTLPFDIELLYPAQFGNNLVLTPHTYRMNSACTFTDTLYLDAQGDPNAIFVIQINGALGTSTYSKVNLINGAQSKNVFWKVEGSVSINDYSVFRGTIICNNGAISLTTGVYLDGRALTTTGAVNTAAITAIMPPGCGATGTSPIIIVQPIDQIVCVGDSAGFSVTALGSGLTYQWRRGTVNLVNGGNISGVTTSVLTINPVTIADTAFNYNVIVGGLSAPNDTSNNVALTLSNGVAISSQPMAQSTCPGGVVSFSVAAPGSALSYQWRKGIVNLVNGGNISGATTATLTVNPVSIADTAYNYNVIVSASCGNDTSVNASLTVNSIPVAVAGSNSPVCTGGTIDLTAQPLTGATYSWSGPAGYSSAAQNPVILFASASNAGNYFLTVSQGGCSSVPSLVSVAVNNCTADLSIIKSVDNSTPFYGATVVFTLVVMNNGTGNATGVAVNDVLQNGYVYGTSSATTGVYDPSTGVWMIGNLNSGSSATLTITCMVVSGGNYVNTAIIYGNESDPDMTNNNSSVETHPTDFFIPDGFSPNGDGINDLFVVRGIENYPKNSLVIFNRWGDKIFNASPYTNNWDGKCKVGLRIGDELPVGTYFFLLDLGDGSDVIKGTIYLNK